VRPARVALTLIALAAAAYRAIWWEPRHVLARRLDGVRVPLAKAERVVARLDTETPDLVALLGVYADPLGHTHGSQVDLPLLRERITPSRFGARYAGGVVEEGDRVLFVSRGVGTSRLPLRFMAPPEVALLELKRRG
jgi:hypothetical protein